MFHHAIIVGTGAPDLGAVAETFLKTVELFYDHEVKKEQIGL
jgi:hypothetical protein